MRAVALLTSVSLLTSMTACFPRDPHARFIAKLSEGGAVIAGIGLLAIAGTGADCDAKNGMIAMRDDSCHTKATILSDLGLALLLGGLVGFIATVSTAEEDKKPIPTNILATPPPKLDPTPMKVPTPEPSPTPAPTPTPAAGSDAPATP